MSDEVQEVESTELVPTEQATEVTVSPLATGIATMTDAEFDLALKHGKALRERLQKIHREVMQDGVDYGVIPGTGDKPTLLKAGTEVLNKFAGFRLEVSSERTIGDGVNMPTITWDSVTKVYDADDRLVAVASGSCNSWEPRYRWRKAERKCPACGAAAIIKGKEEYGGGWVCWKKRDGCGAKFEDHEIEDPGKVENPDPWGLDNTILKISEKRSNTAATLTANAASGSFTQDVEDMPAAEPPKKQPAPTKSEPAKKKQAPPPPKEEIWRGLLTEMEPRKVKDALVHVVFGSNDDGDVEFSTLDTKLAQDIGLILHKVVDVGFRTTPKGGKQILSVKLVEEEATAS